jgi:adenylyltransferase/sulfurtransferase
MMPPDAHPPLPAPWPGNDSLEILPAELQILLREHRDEFRLIDCREADEWHLCRIDGAQLLPLSQFAAEAPKILTDPAEKVVIYCHHGMRSQHAAHFLRQRGQALAWSLKGGIDAWSHQIDPHVPRY